MKRKKNTVDGVLRWSDEQLNAFLQNTDPAYCTDEEFDLFGKALAEFKRRGIAAEPASFLGFDSEDDNEEGDHSPEEGEAREANLLELQYQIDEKRREGLMVRWAERVEEFARYYMTAQTHKPVAIACSFGKDSTVVLRLACEGLEKVPPDQRTREVHVVTSDTVVENPILKAYVHDQVRQVNEWAQKNNMPLTAHIVRRKAKRGILFTLLGKGYVLPDNRQNRWCTHALKIEPQNELIEKLDPSFLLLGTRNEESTHRSTTINKYAFLGNRVGYSPYSPGRRVYSPIKDLTTREVWDLLEAPLPWGSSLPVRMLYREATGECGLLTGGATEYSSSCGSRFGCWLCPVILKDKSTENMADIYTWLYPLTVWRNLLIKLWTSKESRSGYKRDGNPVGEGMGCIALQTRKEVLQALLATQTEVNEQRESDGEPPLELIEAEELALIYEQWEEDEKRRPWLIDNQEHNPGDFRAAAVELAGYKRLLRFKKYWNKSSYLQRKASVLVLLADGRAAAVTGKERRRFWYNVRAVWENNVWHYF